MALRKLTPGGYEYLTGSVACADRGLEPGESLSDYYLAHGYPAGKWFGAGAHELGVSGEVTAAQMNALYGEGRHPNADAIEADMIRTGATPEQAMRATQLGRRFAQYGGLDSLRSNVIAAYKQYNVDHGRPVGAPLNAATRADIRRAVLTSAFQTAHDGRVPSADELTGWLADQKRQLKTAVAGFEAVFAPPKSVSVAWALADEATRERLASLHRQAVKDTLHHLQANAAFTRQGDYGEAQVDIVGITAAMFEHWDSRAGDPHLHTHVPISAKVKRSTDGQWTTVDGRTMFAATVTMSEFYDSRLRDLLRDEGATWVQRPAGGVDHKRPVWELDGVPQELLRAFSQRAQQIGAERANQIVAFHREHRREPTPKEVLEIGRRAQYGTRAAKQAPKTLADHQRRWRAFAETVIDPATVAALGAGVFGGPAEPLSNVDIDQLGAVTRQAVSDKYSHWNRWNVEAEAHRQTAHLRVPADQRQAVVTLITDAVVGAGDAVALQSPALVAEPQQLRRRSGESVFLEHNAQRYTTEQTLREEADLVTWARRRDGHRLTQETVTNAVHGLCLNAGQRRMITEFARSGRRVQLALAPAGAGKTTAMHVLAQAWRSAGGRVYAFGPSARAAQELGEAIDAPPHTLHQVTAALAMGTAERAYGFRRGDLLIIDEAAMAGTHTLHDVVRYALKRGADIRLVGDDRQLGAVEAGGAIRLIAHDVGAVRFTEVVRFHDPQQAAASLRIRSGDVAGIGYYMERGWIEGGSRETMRDAAQRAWRADLDAGRQSLIIVPTNEDVVWLNLQARAQRIARGNVDTGAAAALHDGTHASAGDWIVTRDNNRLLSLFGGRDFVKNGDVWAVTAVRRDGSLEVTHLTNASTTVLPSQYVTAHVELAYATTVNRTQGMTSEGSAHALVPQTMTREQLYPALTRARHDNRLYVETHQHTIDNHQETPLDRTIESVLAGVLNHTGIETAATEQLRESLGAEESLATLVARYSYVAHLGSNDRIDRLLTQHAPQSVGQPAAPALRQTLRNAEDFGWQAEHLIPLALAQGRLTDARDPAAVLQWRIEQHLEHQQPPERTANLEEAAERIANRPQDLAYAADVLSTLSGPQQATGAGRPALPWLPRAQQNDPELVDYLTELNAAIAARAAELRGQVAAQQPAWTAGLGHRPTSPNAAARWDDLAGLAAAYRETFNVTTVHPTAPLGPEPATSSAKAKSWHDITTRWSSTMTAYDDIRSDNETRIDALAHSIRHGQLRSATDSEDMFTGDERNRFDDLMSDDAGETVEDSSQSSKIEY